MRQVLLTATFIALLFGVLSPVARADDGLSSDVRVERITQDPGQDLDPALVMGNDGRVSVIWKHYEAENTEGRLQFARSLAWAINDLAPLSPLPAESVVLIPPNHVSAQIAWLQSSTDTVQILQQPLAPGAAPHVWDLPSPPPTLVAIDRNGDVHSVWVQNQTISYAATSRDVTITLNIEASSIVEPSLAVDSRAQAYLAWSSQFSPDQPSRVFVTTLISDTTPVEIGLGRSPKLAVGPSGRLHLAWLTDEGLRYANSQNWSVAHAISDQSLTPDQFALAIQPDDTAHLAWVEGQTLWRASSLDWARSRIPLALDATPTDLTLHVDANGCPHLAWVAADEQGNTDIYYLRARILFSKLRIPYPVGGEILTADTLVKAESNLAINRLTSVAFYAQARTESVPQEQAPMISLGFDQNARDGWSTPLRVSSLDSTQQYRIVALGTEVGGQVIRAESGWFTTQRSDAPHLWVYPPEETIMRGQSSLGVLTHTEGSRGLDVFLAPLESSLSQSNTWANPFAWPAHYLGHYELRRSGAEWEQIEYNSRIVPDGIYRAIIAAPGTQDLTTYGASEPFIIENTLFPSVEWVLPTTEAVFESNLDLVVSAHDLDGQVQRVEFYIERRQPAVQTRYSGRLFERDTPRIFWLGHDTNGADGWRLTIRANEALDGDDWRAWAVAFDDHGLAGSAQSDRFAIVGSNRPYLRLLSPLPNSSLIGDESVILDAPVGADYIQTAQALAEYPNGDLEPLGQMGPVEGKWRWSWNTRLLPDGQYALVIVATTHDGRQFVARSDNLAIANAKDAYAFLEPPPEAQTGGAVYLSVGSKSDPTTIADVYFYYRDSAGDIVPIGQGIRRADGWGLLWDTDAVFDGHYDVLAVISDLQGHTTSIEQGILIDNSSFRIAFAGPRRGERWEGTREIAWQIGSPAQKPLSSTIEYSPDAGAHWLPIAVEITATRSLAWNTLSYPDSTHALLRLGVTDGQRYRWATSEMFTIDNVNEAPNVTILSPLPGSMWRGMAPIVWQAADTDGDPVQIRIAYRLEASADWITLASDLANSGRYEWNTANLPSGESYALRVTAVDPSGATHSDIVENIRTSTNTPPIVRLLWPKDGIRAEHEAVILWEAFDPDGDALAIDLYYSDNGGQAWLPLAEGLSNTGYYVWQVSYLPSGAQYRVRIIARDGAAQSSSENSGAFTVGYTSQPQVTLLTPNAGERLAGSRLITWTSFSPNQEDLYVSLSIRPTNQADWQVLVAGMPDDGSYLWDTQKHADGAYDLRITVTNTQALAQAVLLKPVSIANRQNHPPEVTLTAPQSGEQWSGIREITWDAWDRDGDVITATLQLSADGGETWTKLASLDARLGRFLWDTRRVQPAPNYKLRIEVSDSAARAEDKSAGVFYLTNRNSQPPAVRLTSPSVATPSLRNGLVTWIAEDADGDSLSLSLAASQDGGRTWREIARDLSNTGEYALDTAALTFCKACRLRIIADDGLYQSEDSAVLGSLGLSTGWPKLTIEAPQEMSTLTGKSEIRWQFDALSESNTHISLDASRDGGQSWIKLGEDPANTGQYALDTTSLANGTYLLRLTAKDDEGSQTQVWGPMTIRNPERNAPLVAFIYPKGGEIWSGVREIKWRASDADGDDMSINLAYSTDKGANWRALAYGIENTGSYVWDTTTIPDCEHVWLRISASDGRFISQAQTAGALAVRNGHTPTIALLWPQSGAQLAGEQRVTWVANHYGGRSVRVSLELSTDLGQTWQVLAQDLPAQGSYLWDTTSLPERSQALIRVIATDGVHSAMDATWQAIIIRGNPQPPALPFFLP